MTHELAVCQALVAQVGNIVGPPDARVQNVHIGIGPLSGVKLQLLESIYPLACAGAVSEGSRLENQKSEMRVRCRGCTAETVAAPSCLICGLCGYWHTDLLSGDELLLLQVNLETREDEREVVTYVIFAAVRSPARKLKSRRATSWFACLMFMVGPRSAADHGRTSGRLP